MARTSTSLILIVHNHERFLPRCLESIVRQSVPPDELILCDDASSDSSPRLLTEFARQHAGRFQTKLVLNERNEGLGETLNRAFKDATGEWWVIMSGDDYSFDTRIERTLVAIGAAPAARLICSNARVVDAAGVASRPYFLRDQSASYTLETLARSITGILGATAAIHREVWEIFGGMPAGIYQEDVVFPFRAALIGKNVYLDEELVAYRYHGNNESFDGFNHDVLAMHFARPGWLQRRADNLANAARCRLQDLVCARSRKRLDQDRVAKIERLCERTLRDTEFERTVAGASLWKIPFLTMGAFWSGTRFLRCVRIAVFYMFPRTYALQASLKARVSAATRRVPGGKEAPIAVRR